MDFRLRHVASTIDYIQTFGFSPQSYLGQSLNTFREGLAIALALRPGPAVASIAGGSIGGRTSHSAAAELRLEDLVR